MSEMCESLGNAFYSELMASQSYGWPMRTVTSKKKRDLAVLANVCFQAAIRHADDSIETDDENENHCTWDLLFMVGKVSMILFAVFLSYTKKFFYEDI